MHAFLLVNTGFMGLSKKLEANPIIMPLQKIEDVRAINKFLKLSVTQKTLLVCENIHTSSTEALNAFLKTLEEPGENIYFALTSPSISSVLPTIVSRCQIIKSISNDQFPISNIGQIENFIESKIGEKLKIVDKIKDREAALLFINDLIFYHKNKNIVNSNLELLLKTHTRLKASGNVNLHLTNFAINYG